jgi:fucose permease
MISQKRRYSLVLLALAYLSFVSLGLPDGLNGVAWPSIRAYFNLPVNALGSLLVIFTAGYLASSFWSGRMMALMSVGSLLALSCLAAAVSLIGYAVSPAWWVMLALGAIAGLGAGGIDTGLNTFAAVEFSPRMVNWLHACYGVGAATGPIIMTRVLAANQPWQRGYAIVGCWQLLLAACFGLTRRSWPPPTDSARLVTATRASNSSTLRLPIIWLSIAVFFLYTGIEAAAGVWAYTLFTESRGVSMMTAGLWVTVYWAGLTVGRLLAGVALGFVSANRLLIFHAVGMSAGAALIWLNATTLLSFLGLGLMGFSSASVFPSLIATTPGRLGPTHTSNGIGFQIAAAALGQSFLPAFTGVLAAKLGLEIIGPVLFVSCLALLGLLRVLTSTNREINGTPAPLGPIASEPSQHV